MLITDVENLSAAELKAQRKDLAAAIAGEPAEELAARYVQARLDAKVRDEKLAEQGKTIVALQEAVALHKERGAQLLQERDATCAALAVVKEQIAGARSQAAAKEERLIAALNEATVRGNRLLRMSQSHHAAVASAAKTLNEALAAQAIDAADQG